MAARSQSKELPTTWQVPETPWLRMLDIPHRAYPARRVGSPMSCFSAILQRSSIECEAELNGIEHRKSLAVTVGRVGGSSGAASTAFSRDFGWFWSWNVVSLEESSDSGRLLMEEWVRPVSVEQEPEEARPVVINLKQKSTCSQKQAEGH
jgi:hypothetical protein